MTAGEIKTLDDLMKNKQLICKSSDKGGNVVVMDRKQYRQMALKLLRDETTYKILTHNPTQEFLNELKIILLEAKENSLISQNEYNC